MKKTFLFSAMIMIFLLLSTTAMAADNSDGSKDYLIDGNFVYYVDYSDYDQSMPTDYGFGGKVYRSNLDGSGVTLLIPKTINGLWMENGILYGREMCTEDGHWLNNYSKIWTYNLATGAVKKLEMYYFEKGTNQMIDYALNDIWVTSDGIYVSVHTPYNHYLNGRAQEIGLFRMGLDGSNVTKLSDIAGNGLTICDDKIVYNKIVDGQHCIQVCDLGGNPIFNHFYWADNTSWRYVNGRLYFINLYEGGGAIKKVCSMNLDGSDYREHGNCSSTFAVLNDWIYCINGQNSEIYRVKVDGTGYDPILASEVTGVDSVIYNGMAYFTNREKVYAIIYIENSGWAYLPVGTRNLLTAVPGAIPYPSAVGTGTNINPMSESGSYMIVSLDTRQTLTCPTGRELTYDYENKRTPITFTTNREEAKIVTCTAKNQDFVFIKVNGVKTAFFEFTEGAPWMAYSSSNSGTNFCPYFALIPKGEGYLIQLANYNRSISAPQAVNAYMKVTANGIVATNDIANASVFYFQDKP